MYKRNPRRDLSHRGGRISQRPRHMRKDTSSSMMRSGHSPPITYGDSPMPLPPMPYPKEKMVPYPNLKLINRRSVSEQAPHQETHFKNKRPRENVFPKKIHLVPQLRKEFEHKDPMQTPQPQINKPITISPKHPPYIPMRPPPPSMVGNMYNIKDFGKNFNHSPFPSQPMRFGPKEPMMPIMLPPQPVLYDNMIPFPKPPMKILDHLPPHMVMGMPEGVNQFLPRPLDLKSSDQFEIGQLNMRLQRMHKVLEEINNVSHKIKFSVPSTFRIRVGYNLRPAEYSYLENANRVFKYFLFSFLLNGYKESLNFALGNSSAFPEVVWDVGRFSKFLNDESDVALVNSSVLDKMNGKDLKLGVDKGYKLIKWDTMPRITYIIDEEIDKKMEGGERKEVSKDKSTVLIRMIDVNIIVSNATVLNNLSCMYTNINESILKMLGYYSLICPDESYIVIISSILPNLTEQKLKIFYSNLADLLDPSRCDLQVYYLERFIERFLPICFHQNKECWSPITTKIVKVINPLKLANKKYLSCCISLIRSLKSFCDIFVECQETLYSVFLMTLRYLIESGDDSRILLRGESTDLLIQIWLNPSGKKNIIQFMNYDIIRILGTLSGIQSIKLNIWSYLLSPLDKEGSDEPSKSELVLGTIFNKGNNDANIYDLISNDELVYLYNLFPLLSLPNRDNIREDKEGRQYLARVGLYWYVNKYLKIKKNLLQYEKMPVVVRLSYHLYKHYLLSCAINNKSLGSMGYNMDFTRILMIELEKMNNLGVLFEYFLIILMSNITLSTSCLELANVKLSMVLDFLLFNCSFNSTLVRICDDKKDLVRINNFNYLNLTKLSNNNSILLLINLFNKIYSFDCTINSKEFLEQFDRNEESESKLLKNDKKHESSELNTLLDSKSLGFKNYTPWKSGNANENRGRLEGEGFELLDLLLNLNVLTYFINNNVEILRMMLNYLENTVYYYNQDMTSTFCLNTISALVTTAIFQVKQSSNRLNVDVENDQEQVLKELIDGLRKTPLYKLLLLYNINVNTFNLSSPNILISYNPVQKVVVTKQKQNNQERNLDLGIKNQFAKFSSYKKLVLQNMVYENNLTKFMLVQSYIITLEFFHNYQYFLNLNNSSFINTISHEVVGQFGYMGKLDDKHLMTMIYGKDLNLVSFLDKLLNNEYKLPNYCLSVTKHDFQQSDSDISINSYKCNFHSLNTEDAGNTLELVCTFGSLIDYVVTLLTLCKSKRKKPEWFGWNNGLNEEELGDNLVDIFALVYNSTHSNENSFDNLSEEGNNSLILYELLYYISKLSEVEESNSDGNGLEETAEKTLVMEKLETALAIFNKLVDKLSKLNNKNENSIFTDAIIMLFKSQFSNKCIYSQICTDSSPDNMDIRQSLQDQGNEPDQYNPVQQEFEESGEGEKKEASIERENLRLTFEIVIHNKLLWNIFSRFPIILSSIIKLAPINKLLLFLSSFRNLYLNPFKNVPKTTFSLSDNDLTILLTDHRYILSILNKDLLTLMDQELSEEQREELNSKLEVGEWFRYYFLYTQLIVRMYELKYFNSQVVRTDRNFYRNFTMPPAEYKQLNDYEYLSKEIVSYLLNFKEIISDNTLVCYIGSDSKKSLFVHYMMGYSISGVNERGENSTFPGGDDLYLILFLLNKLTSVDNIRILQVFVFSIFPILIHTVPNKAIFDYVYDSLFNIRLNRYHNAFTFLKFLLLTVLFNWYHKYFFTYNFFIYQFNNNKVLSKDLINKYISKYLNNYNIEFNFNFTAVKIPMEYIYQLQVLF